MPSERRCWASLRQLIAWCPNCMDGGMRLRPSSHLGAGRRGLASGLFASREAIPKDFFGMSQPFGYWTLRSVNA